MHTHGVPQGSSARIDKSSYQELHPINQTNASPLYFPIPGITCTKLFLVKPQAICFRIIRSYTDLAEQLATIFNTHYLTNIVCVHVFTCRHFKFVPQTSLSM